MNISPIPTNKDKDELFDRFSRSIQRIYKVKRKTGSLITSELSETIGLFQSMCTTLKTHFPDQPSILYTKQIIEFALTGLGDKVLAGLWHNQDKYPLLNYWGYSSAAIQKRSQSFGVKIAAYLLEKNLELEGFVPDVNPFTLKRYLEENFGLVESEIRILKAYSESDNKGRKQIALDLTISENTVKTHKRKIMEKMGTKSMNEAVAIVKAFKP